MKRSPEAPEDPREKFKPSDYIREPKDIGAKQGPPLGSGPGPKSDLERELLRIQLGDIWRSTHPEIIYGDYIRATGEHDLRVPVGVPPSDPPIRTGPVIPPLDTETSTTQTPQILIEDTRPWEFPISVVVIPKEPPVPVITGPPVIPIPQVCRPVCLPICP